METVPPPTAPKKAKRTAPRQDPNIRNNPWLVELLGDNKARVPSASGGRAYIVDMEIGYCNCDAHGSCWHKDTADLRARLEVTIANCRARYAQMRLAELIAEDERLRAVLAENTSISITAQYGVLGDAINMLIEPVAVAA